MWFSFLFSLLCLIHSSLRAYILLVDWTALIYLSLEYLYIFRFKREHRFGFGFWFFLVLSVHDTHQLLALLCVCVRQIEQQAILMLLFIQPFFFFFLFFHFFLYSSFIHFMYTFGSRESISQTPNRFSLHFYHIIPSFSSLLLSSQNQTVFFQLKLIFLIKIMKSLDFFIWEKISTPQQMCHHEVQILCNSTREKEKGEEYASGKKNQ